jgi:hypothetical protein
MKAPLSTLVLAMSLMALNGAPAATHYVDLNNPAPAPPYTNWGTAARVIQDAVDAALPGDKQGTPR